MTVRERLPHPVREIENLWIPLGDGARLAARVWLPEDAESHPVPVIFEYIPYRKRDLTRSRDEPMHRYFAGHGYAAVRVDLRGSGDSDGVLTDEYTERETLDAVEAIAWLAHQPWSSGKVGMTGISWGGFNSLQVAARRPPELKAVISLCASDDRYTDDAHYMGGCLLNENLTWGAVLFTFNAYPPDPQISGESWRETWHRRLEGATLFPALWAGHARRDAYWRHGSVRCDYTAIRCPVYAVGGWADGYSNAVPRLIEGLEVPRKGLIGPWAHTFPHDGVPGPAIGFLQEALRWWDFWLKGIDTGVMDEPRLRVWMQEGVAPAPFHDTRPGRWVAETEWPSPRIEPRRFRLGRRTLEEDGSDGAPYEGAARDRQAREKTGHRGQRLHRFHIRSPQTTGLAAGDWCGFGAEGEAPTDQREDGGKSLSFDSAPLAERLEILGAPEVRLELSLDRPLGFVAVRLNDVAPDGASTRVTYGLLNLAHRNGAEKPSPLVPGERTRVRLRLDDIAHAFAPGHVLRLSISTAYWPLVWPSPEPVTLTLLTGSDAASGLELPVRPPSELDAALPPFAPPEHGTPMHHETLHAARYKRVIERDLASHETLFTVLDEGAEFEGAKRVRIPAIDLELASEMLRRYRIGETDPLTARAEVRHRTLFHREGWTVRVETEVRQSATRTHFRIEAVLRAWEGDELVFERTWDERVPRDCV